MFLQEFLVSLKNYKIDFVKVDDGEYCFVLIGDHTLSYNKESQMPFLYSYRDMDIRCDNIKASKNSIKIFKNGVLIDIISLKELIMK